MRATHARRRAAACGRCKCPDRSRESVASPHRLRLVACVHRQRRRIHRTAPPSSVQPACVRHCRSTSQSHRGCESSDQAPPTARWWPRRCPQPNQPASHRDRRGRHREWTVWKWTASSRCQCSVANETPAVCDVSPRFQLRTSHAETCCQDLRSAAGRSAGRPDSMESRNASPSHARCWSTTAFAPR